MSTLRVSNIEAKADVSSPTINEKIKITNSDGEVMLHLDGATSGITTVGINTTAETFNVDENQNVTFTGSITSSGVSTFSSGLNVTGGSVGIGTDDPTTPLEVATSVDGEATLATFKNTSGGGINQTVDIKLGLESLTSSNVILRAGKQSNHNSGAATDNFFAIHTTLDNASSEKLRITSSGSVGIGTDNPGASLQITADSPGILFQDANSGATESKIEGLSGHLYYTTDNLNRDHIFSATDESEALRITGDGNVGIGTDDPQHDIHLYRNGDATLFIQADADNVDETHNPKISLSQDGLTSSVFDVGINGTAGDAFTNALANTAYLYSVSNSSSNGIQFATNGAARMYLDNSGNLGIGSESPTELLDVAGNTTIASNGRVNIYRPTATATNTAFQINSDVGGTDTLQFVIQAGGEVQIANGNLVFSTSGTGIDFSATSDASGMTSELLDDYEEGTFTPVLGATSVNVTYTAQQGHYTKIGRTVFFTIQLNLSTVTSVGTGSFTIGGLPFSGSTGSFRYVIQTSNVNFDATRYSHYVYKPGATTLGVLYTNDNASWSVAQATDFAVNNGAAITVTGFYKI